MVFNIIYIIVSISMGIILLVKRDTFVKGSEDFNSKFYHQPTATKQHKFNNAIAIFAAIAFILFGLRMLYKVIQN